MELHLARVVLENTEERNQEVTIDLVLDGRSVKAGLEYFGLWQDKHEQVRCPFVMAPDGGLDFGTGYDGADRYYETDIVGLELSIGQQVGWRSDGVEQTFRVTGITQLV